MKGPNYFDELEKSKKSIEILGGRIESLKKVIVGPLGAVNAASVTVPAPSAVPVQAVRPTRPGYPARNVYAYPNGYTYPQPQYYNYRGRRAVSFQEYFGFDGIPFNGSHIQAFRRYH